MAGLPDVHFWTCAGGNRAFGAAVLGIVLFDEPVTALRVGFLALLLVAIIGLEGTATT